ncbi:hypothetical protein MTO96_021619 [Rhipicephalus appendiculatus]
MDFFTPLGLDQEEQESDEESGIVAPASSRRSSVAPGTVDDAIPAMQRLRSREVLAPRVSPEASESSDRNAPSLGKSSTGFKGSVHSAPSTGIAEAIPVAIPSPTTKKRGSLLERLSSAIMAKVKRNGSTAAEDSSRGGTPTDADLREGNPSRVQGTSGTRTEATQTEPGDTNMSPLARTSEADLRDSATPANTPASNVPAIETGFAPR